MMMPDQNKSPQVIFWLFTIVQLKIQNVINNQYLLFQMIVQNYEDGVHNKHKKGYYRYMLRQYEVS